MRWPRASKAEASLFNDADLGRAEDAIANLPPCLHRDRHMIVLIFTLLDRKDSFVQFGIKSGALRIILLQVKASEHVVHDFARELLSINIGQKLLLETFQIVLIRTRLLISVLNCEADGVAHLEQVFGKLGDGELLLILDHLAVAHDELLILSNLLGVLDAECLHFLFAVVELVLVLVDLLLHGLDLDLLLVEELLDLLDVFLAQVALV